MNANQIEAGKKVWYYPIAGEREREAAVITSGPYNICGATCCKIDIRSSVVDIDNLEEREGGQE